MTGTDQEREPADTSPGLADARLVRERYLQVLRQPAARVRREVAFPEPIHSPRADGSWPDLNYGSAAVNDWPPAHHLGRTLVLAHDSARAAEAMTALRFWLRQDFLCPNWWFNQLGSPRQLAAIGLLLDEHLGPDERAQLSARIARAVWTNMTGQNLIWAADATIARGLLLLDPAIVADGFAHAWQPIQVSTDEGVQPDASFHQHGPQLYNGGYGHDFAVDASRLVWLARGTGFAAGPARRDLLASYLLDGLRPVVHDGRYDYTVLGRTVVRPTAAAAAGDLATPARHLAEAGSPRADELRAFVHELQRPSGRSGREATPPAEANSRFGRHYWRSDLSVHRRPGWALTVRASSSRTHPTEIGNGENLLGYFLGSGVTTLWRSGHDDIGALPAVWDWRALPGTTVARLPDPPPTMTWTAGPDGGPRFGADDFVGGLADGSATMGTASLTDEYVTAGRKTWLAVDDAFVVIAAGIQTSPDLAPDVPVVTSVDRRVASGPIIRGEAAGRGWVWHAGIGYVSLLPGQPLTALDQVRTGSWRTVDRSGDTTPIEARVFGVDLDHGHAPTGAGYAYAVVPGCSIDELRAWAEAPPVQVLARSCDLQALHDRRSGVIAATFVQPGALTDPDGALVAEVDRPVCLQLDAGAGRVAVAAPDQAAGTVEVRTPHGGARLELPDGGLAGSAVTGWLGPISPGESRRAC